MKAPLVSIIIPTYDRCHLIGETLDSIIAQSYKVWECLVIDDGSRDYTRELLEFYTSKDPRIVYLKRPPDKIKGASSCRNYGLSLCKGEVVNFFDSDDLMHPEKIRKQIEALNTDQSFLVVCKSLEFKGTPRTVLGKRYTYLDSSEPFQSFITGKIKWLTQAPLWRKEFLLKNNLCFDETLEAGQDWEFHVRALSLVKNFQIVPEPLVYLRVHNENITNDKDRAKIKWNYFKARLKIFKMHRDEIDMETGSYLLNFLVTRYKEALRFGYYAIAVKMWKVFLIKERKLTFLEKSRLLLALFSFYFFGKGNILIAELNINLSKRTNAKDFFINKIRYLKKQQRENAKPQFKRRIEKRWEVFWQSGNYIEHNLNQISLENLQTVENWQRSLSNKLIAKTFVQKFNCRVAKILWQGNIEEFQNLNLNFLPAQYVIKPIPGHGTKGVFLINNGHNLFDGRYYTNSSLKEHILQFYESKILIEEFLPNSEGEFVVPNDYRFYMFNGEIACIQLDKRKSFTKDKVSFYSQDWKPLKNKILIDASLDHNEPEPPPAHFEEMKKKAIELSRIYKIFVRIDFYSTLFGPVFGEFTPTPRRGKGVTPYGNKFLISYWDKYCKDLI